MFTSVRFKTQSYVAPHAFRKGIFHTRCLLISFIYTYRPSLPTETTGRSFIVTFCLSPYMNKAICCFSIYKFPDGVLVCMGLASGKLGDTEIIDNWTTLTSTNLARGNRSFPWITDSGSRKGTNAPSPICDGRRAAACT